MWTLTQTNVHLSEKHSWQNSQKHQADNRDHHSALLLASPGIPQQQGSGWISKPSKKWRKRDWGTGHSGRLLSITVWRTIISRLCEREIISFRKTKCVKFIPGATNYFCPLKKGQLDCDDILEELCLLISSHAFYLSCGLIWGGESNLCTNTLSTTRMDGKRVRQTIREMLQARKIFNIALLHEMTNPCFIISPVPPKTHKMNNFK